MISRRSSGLALAAAVAFAGLAAASAVAAQPPPYSQNPYDQTAEGPPDQSAGPDLAGLHAALQLTPAQDPAWRAFAAASTPDPQQEARERSAQSMMATLRSPQRVDLSISAAEADLQTLRERGAALKAFYAVLSPSQQAVFDRRTLPEQGQ
jgi:protein CpxP